MALSKMGGHNGAWRVLHGGIVSDDYVTKEAAIEAVVDRAAALIGLAEKTTDDKEAAALLELAVEEIVLAESEIARSRPRF